MAPRRTLGLHPGVYCSLVQSRARRQLVISDEEPQTKGLRMTNRNACGVTKTLSYGTRATYLARPVTSSMMGFQGPMTPRMRTQTPVSTPTECQWLLFFRIEACIFQCLAPRGTVEVVEHLKEVRSTLPSMTSTPGWAAAGTIPAWSGASARQPPASPRSGTYGLPFQRASPMNVATFKERAGALEQEGNVGAQGGRYAPNAVPPQGQVTSPHYDQGVPNGSHGSERGAPQDVPIVGIPTELRNAVKAIVSFYSETATYKRAAAFWRSFDRCMLGLDAQMRLTAFEQCLKGTLGQEWCYNARINDFETLGAVLNANLAASIQEACALLLYKNLHLPVEEADEFANSRTTLRNVSAVTSTQSQMLHQLQQMNQLMLKRQQDPGTSQGFVGAVAPTNVPSSSVQGLPRVPRKGKWFADAVDVLDVVVRRVRGAMAAKIGATSLGTTRWSATGRNPKGITGAGNVAKWNMAAMWNVTVPAETLSTRSKPYEGALETITEDASGARSSQLSAVTGQVSAGQERTEAQKAEEDKERTKGKDSTQHYERLLTDEELDMLEHGGDQ
ncbi:uncharacterized protein PITG_22426, partial [Phytophthora infestans T30-4]